MIATLPPPTDTESEPAAPNPGEASTEVRRQEAVLKAGALQNAILSSANFSSIATDEKGVIQIFNVGAERMLGYVAADVINKITPRSFSRLPAGSRTSMSSSTSARMAAAFPPSSRSRPCATNGAGSSATC
jgi:PAS domain-containing protein